MPFNPITNARNRASGGGGSDDGDDPVPFVGDSGEETFEGPLGYGSGERNIPTSRAATPGPGSVNYLSGNQGGARAQLYFAGDEWKPMNTPQLVPGLQQKLVAAGLLDPKEVRPGGVWDHASAAAYLTVLEMANRAGVNASVMLDQLVSNPTPGEPGPEAPVIQLTNPAELRESFRETFQSRVGYNPSQAAMDAFVNTYHGIEASKQKALNDAAPGSTFVQGPSVETAATEELRKQYAAEEQAYSTITRMQDWETMLGPIA